MYTIFSIGFSTYLITYTIFSIGFSTYLITYTIFSIGTLTYLIVYTGLSMYTIFSIGTLTYLIIYTLTGTCFSTITSFIRGTIFYYDGLYCCKFWLLISISRLSFGTTLVSFSSILVNLRVGSFFVGKTLY
jgi:hypothetical protein